MKRVSAQALALVLTLFLLTGPLPLQTAAADGMPETAANLPEAQEFAAMGLPQLLQWAAELCRDQWVEPLRMLAALAAFLLCGAAALCLAPGEGWRQLLEWLLLLGAFLLTAEPLLALTDEIASTVQGWYAYLISFVPVFSGVMLSCGQPGAAAVYSGMFLMMAGLSAQLISALAMPLLQIYLALNTAAGLCFVDGVQELCGLLGDAVRWLIKLLAAVFAGVLGLQTVLAQGTDSLAAKTGQFVLSSAVPLVGGVASDAMGSVLAGLQVLKGSLGFAAIAVLAAAFVPLLLRCVLYGAALAASALLAKAAGLGRASGVLKGAAQSISICVSFLVFFFMLVVLATALMIMIGRGG